MFQILFGLAALALVFGDGKSESPEVKRIKEGADGRVTDLNGLARDFWKARDATYVPESKWILMTRDEKSSVLQAREALDGYFAKFSIKVQEHVRKAKPKRAKP